MNNQHVKPYGSDWAVKSEGNVKATLIVNSRDEAIRIASGMAANHQADVVIHDKDGSVQVKHPSFLNK